MKKLYLHNIELGDYIQKGNLIRKATRGDLINIANHHQLNRYDLVEISSFLLKEIGFLSIGDNLELGGKVLLKKKDTYIFDGINVRYISDIQAILRINI